MPAVLERVRTTLDAGRAAGISFEEAWPHAMHRGAHEAAAVDVEDAGEWIDVLAETQPAWQAAFEGRTAGRAERALLTVAVDEDREPIIEEPSRELAVVAGTCAHCGQPIPEERIAKSRAPVRYCRDRCRKNASWERTRAAARL